MPTGIAPPRRYYGLVRLLASLSLQRGLPSSLAELSGHAIPLCPARALARRFAIAFGDLPSASLRRISFRLPKSIRQSPVGFMMSEHWPRGTLVTRLYERGSFALSLIRSSGETRAHRSRTTLRFVYVGLRPRSGSARTTLLWEQKSRANRVRFPFSLSRRFSSSLPFRRCRSVSSQASDVSLLFAIRSLRRACML